MIILYILITFIVFFFMYKKYWCKVEEYTKESYMNNWVDCKYFWAIIITSIFWFMAIPLTILWKLLDYLYNKFLNKTNEKNN